jgi:predicted deacylase
MYLGTPLWPAAADLAALLGAEATLLAEDSGVTPFDEACSRIWWRLAERFPRHPIPPACLAATVELRGRADVSHEFASQDAQHIIEFLQRRGFVSGKSPKLPGLRNEATPLQAVAHIKAEVPGIVVFLKRPGDRVQRGEIVAEIVNPLETETEKRVTAVTSSIDGLLFSLSSTHYARPGCILAKVAGSEPLKAKGENLLTL